MKPFAADVTRPSANMRSGGSACDDAAIAEALMALAYERGPGKTFCPSEVARAVAPDGWRPLMPDVRRIAGELPLEATQKGVRVDPGVARGPIRLGLGESKQSQ